MPVAILVLAIVAYGYVMVAYPEYRMPGLVLGALIALGLGIYFWRNDPETARAAIRIAPEELVIDRVALDRTARGATLSGRVANTSERFRLREMTIALRLHDCPEAEADPAACPVIGEATAIARPDTPPGQIRGFSAHYVFSNLPPVAGDLRFDWDIAATRATE